MKSPHQIVGEYKKLLEQIPSLIKASGLKEKFIYEQIGLRKDLYYRRKNKPEVWTFEELEKLFDLLDGKPATAPQHTDNERKSKPQ